MPVLVYACRYLIDSKEAYFPESLPVWTDPTLPKLLVVAENTDQQLADVGAAAAELNRAIEDELLEHGALLVRGYGALHSHASLVVKKVPRPHQAIWSDVQWQDGTLFPFSFFR